MSSPDRTFAAGEWYAVTGDEVILVLPPTERPRVAGLWELADSGATADELLDAVLAGGLRSLTDLVLVAHGAHTARVLVRGGATVTVTTRDGERAVRPVDGTTWVDEVVPEASGWHVQVASGGAEPSLPLPVGLTRVSSVAAGNTVEPHPEPVPPPAPELVPVPEPDAPEVVAEPTPVAADEWSTDQDGQTRAGTPAQDFDRPVIPGQEHAPAVVSQPVATLVFSTGDVIEVDRAILVGRAPEARRFASQDQPQLVTVSSPNQEISSTHLEIRPGAGADHGMAIVTDLGSTNGTVVAQPGLSPEELQPGIAVSLIPGAVLDLGDGVTIQVTNA